MPDANEFARTVLYNLAALSAEVEELKLLQCDTLAQLTSRPAEEFRTRYQSAVETRTAHLYHTFCESAKLMPPPSDPDPPSLEANPRG